MARLDGTYRRKRTSGLVKSAGAKKLVYARVLKDRIEKDKQNIQIALEKADAGRLLFGKE